MVIIPSENRSCNNLLHENLLEQFSGLLSSRFGLCFQKKGADLFHALRKAAPALGFNGPESCMIHFLSPGATSCQWDILVSHLTIGESFFFRDFYLFHALKTRIIPSILQEMIPVHGFLNIWSAGCAKGQEPYSLAILLDRMRFASPHLKVSIMASDINPVFLEKAREGIYSPWSFRGLDQIVQARYFTPTGHNLFALSPRIKSMVRFFRMNLMDPLPLEHDLLPETVHLLLCRNVLMYFSGSSRRKALNTLHEALIPGGYFIPSSSEAGNIEHDGFEFQKFIGFTCFRKRNPNHPVGRPSCNYLQNLAAAANKADERRAAVPLEKYGPNSYDDHMIRGQILAIMAGTEASSGNLEAAIQLCLKAIESDRFNAGHRYLLSEIHQECGNTKAAVKSLKEVLFIDPGFIMAHVTLGYLKRRENRLSESKKHFSNAIGLIQRLLPDDPVPCSGDMTASGLLKNLEEINFD